MLNIYFVRHGESELNESGVYYGHTDCNLTLKGIQQADEVKGKLNDKVFSKTFSSPLKRAYDTATIILGHQKKSIIDSRIMEMNFGQWENLNYKAIEKDYPEHWVQFCNDYEATAPPGGECLLNVYDRIKDFIDDLMSAEEKGNILIVSHQGCLRLMLSYLLGMEAKGFWHFGFRQGCYSELQIDEVGHCTVMSINK
ncbi:alpha-ribazole phosphatase [Vallitalea okinawensis]|uniref:alpha-ribazole phosphatase n=1 Tax=Vallitalea okinawensis TaxID=2078660 RepID=UPI000CFDE5AB|nr:alpha-ribazole phosphatase [Vallitalea okinawensis]